MDKSDKVESFLSGLYDFRKGFEGRTLLKLRSLRFHKVSPCHWSRKIGVYDKSLSLWLGMRHHGRPRVVSCHI